MNDIDTDEEMVVCRIYSYVNDPPFFCISKKSFCELILLGDKYVSKYTGQNQHKVSEYELYNLELAGYDTERRIKRRKKETNDYIEDKTSLEEPGNSRSRHSHSYYEYVKNICIHYAMDYRRCKMCQEEKNLSDFILKRIMTLCVKISTI